MRERTPKEEKEHEIWELEYTRIHKGLCAVCGVNQSQGYICQRCHEISNN